MNQPLRVGTKTQVWLAAGGTAGHLHAAVSVAQELSSQVDIVLITSDRAIDKAVVADLPYPSVVVHGTGLARSHMAHAMLHNLRSLGANVATLGKLPRPDVVVSFGGFHTPLVAYYAKAKGAKVILVEQNAALGRANRLTGLIASQILAGLPLELPRRWYSRALITGNQLRPEVLALARREEVRRVARKELDIPENLKVVVVTSGSLGARRINEVVEEAMAQRSSSSCWRCYHFVGAVNGQDGATKSLGPCYVRKGFTPDLYRYLAACDLVVARSGASTVAEICAFGRASVLIPLPSAPGDHQSANARVLADAGATRVVPEDELDARRFLYEVESFLGDDERLARCERAAKSLAKLDATSVVARQVVSLG